mmetsp:Transcript_6025/g.19949  ORF Transcript_6025/g.19949 Transcript_6025/m.19949 type:complete len:224 (-) Transcript_6025:842-1513(-)
MLERGRVLAQHLALVVQLDDRLAVGVEDGLLPRVGIRLGAVVDVHSSQVQVLGHLLHKLEPLHAGVCRIFHDYLDPRRNRPGGVEDLENSLHVLVRRPALRRHSLSPMPCGACFAALLLPRCLIAHARARRRDPQDVCTSQQVHQHTILPNLHNFVDVHFLEGHPVALLELVVPLHDVLDVEHLYDAAVVDMGGAGQARRATVKLYKYKPARCIQRLCARRRV